MTSFHPAVAAWFEETLGTPTEPQLHGWPEIQKGRHTLIAAPTGSGKTLSAFLCAIDDLARRGLQGRLEDHTHVLYVSPLKALANDIRTNLLAPLQGIQETAERMGQSLPQITALVRSGDTTSSQRRKMVLHPPHILVTTPESFYILLTSESGRRNLQKVRTVIVDEIHSLAGNKRGSHLLLSLERLAALTRHEFQRIGLSATQKPVASMARFLCGQGRRASVVDVGHRRRLDLGIVVPEEDLGPVASSDIWSDIYDKIARLIGEHRTTLVFVNTRKLAEKTTYQLAERLGAETVACHHGSLAKEIRLDAEKRLKSGALRAVIATASLELGIDIGSVDLVCQVGTVATIALALQRVGRAGHWKGAVPKGRFFPLTRDELLQSAAAVRAIGRGELDRIIFPPHPLDILSQQITAETAMGEQDEEELFGRFTRAWTYRDLTKESFQDVIAMLSEGTSTRKGRRGAQLHRDRVNGKIRARRGARLAAVTSGGAIPEVADYTVKAEPDGLTVGTVDEDFATESSQGDIFLLGNTSWRVRRIEARSGVVRVEDAHGAAPTIPFWFGEAPARSDELSHAFSELREYLATASQEEAKKTLRDQCRLCPAGATQAWAYAQAGKQALGAAPTLGHIVAERFFDEAGGMQLILHSPLGSRINRAWGLALRKKFCRSFNFELQAAATENAINISLSDQHSFPLDSVFAFLSSNNVRQVLIQAMLDSPLFPTRWRWNAGRALQILRFQGGKKVPPAFQRMRSDDLLAAVFPQSAACLENIAGDREVPEHPLVEETVRDCLIDAMDIEGLEEVIRGIENGRIECRAVDRPEPSPFAAEILNASAFAFLDDAPLEERRARAVQVRRSLPSADDEMGALDAAAIRKVIEEASPPVRDADELHDLLLSLIVMPQNSLKIEREWIDRLLQDGRLVGLTGPSADHGGFWAARERVRAASLAFPQSVLDPPTVLEDSQDVLWKRDRDLTAEEARHEVIRGWMEYCGPVSEDELSQRYGFRPSDVEIALAALEGQGQILRGRFRPRISGHEWCDRRLLARIHRLTLGRLRSEVQPVSAADFMRFLFRWQHAAAGSRLHGETGLAHVLDRLQGFEIASAAWESAVLPDRVSDYQPELLDRLCLSGRFAWGRLSQPEPPPNRQDERQDYPRLGRRQRRRAIRPTRMAPITFIRRSEWNEFLDIFPTPSPDRMRPLSSPARAVQEQLGSRGASFVEDLVRSTGLLPSQVEDALWELTAAGVTTADGFDNLRALIDPERRLATSRRPSKRHPTVALGRWTLLRSGPEEAFQGAPDRAEWWARKLLNRWGVVLREIVLRENSPLPWREILAVLRRLEARGEIRGGRFVGGLLGEQFALPEALESLRMVRRSPSPGETVRISAADPLNLTGVLLPGPRVRPHPSTLLRFKDGVLVDRDASPLVRRLSESASA